MKTTEICNKYQARGEHEINCLALGTPKAARHRRERING